MPSCTSRGPSSEITTVSTYDATSAACCSISNPVVTSVMRMRSACSSLQSAHRFRCRSGSPPVSITRWTRSARMASTWRDKIVRADLALFGVGLPDVAHHAAAVARAVNAQRENRQAFDPAGHPAASPPRHFGEAQPLVRPRSLVPAAAFSTRAGRSIAPPIRGAPSTRAGHASDAGCEERSAKCRLGHTGLAVDHRHSHVRAAGADEAVERAGRESRRTIVRSAGRTRCELSGRCAAAAGSRRRS